MVPAKGDRTGDEIRGGSGTAFLNHCGRWVCFFFSPPPFVFLSPPSLGGISGVPSLLSIGIISSGADAFFLTTLIQSFSSTAALGLRGEWCLSTLFLPQTARQDSATTAPSLHGTLRQTYGSPSDVLFFVARFAATFHSLTLPLLLQFRFLFTHHSEKNKAVSVFLAFVHGPYFLLIPDRCFTFH